LLPAVPKLLVRSTHLVLVHAYGKTMPKGLCQIPKGLLPKELLPQGCLDGGLQGLLLAGAWACQLSDDALLSGVMTLCLPAWCREYLPMPPPGWSH